LAYIIKKNNKLQRVTKQAYYSFTILIHKVKMVQKIILSWTNITLITSKAKINYNEKVLFRHVNNNLHKNYKKLNKIKKE
jgi:hypothetical protein